MHLQAEPLFTLGTSSKEEDESSVELPRALSKLGLAQSSGAAPSASSEGMVSLMKEFLSVQSLRVERYLLELRGLKESILQMVQTLPLTPE